MQIFSNFDGGNIKVVDASNLADIRLEILPDRKADFFQWFCFRVVGAQGKPIKLNIINAGSAFYLDGWKGYRAVASYDRNTWFRVNTEFDGKALTIAHTPAHNAIYYAYFAPYTTGRYIDFIARQMTSPLAKIDALGQTLDGQCIDIIQVGEPGDAKRAFWVIARQHPGETMGSWWMEGFLPRLLDEKDAVAARLRDKAVFYVVPCMNLDGARRGHLRTNAVGTDLNRAWRNESMEKSPEVFLVLQRMRETGVDFFLDVHGDEAVANNFLAGAYGIPSWDARHEALYKRYSDGLLAVSDDFQTEDGYPKPAPGEANLDFATYYVAETWDCLSMTLEMPFKDATVNPEPIEGWSPERCRQLGRDNLTVMAGIVDLLR
jgi:murein tripeptide amidase MpaA